MKERHTALLNYIIAHGRTEVNTLAEKLNTSKVTIRKDLDYLASRGMLKRERGYAVPNDPGDINFRMAFHYDVKQRIAKKAASYIQDGETLIIESGSTCALFAEELAKSKKNVTIITNSFYLVNYLKEYTNIQLILLGGILQQHGQALVGPLTKSAIQAFHVDKMFIGTDGYSKASGFTGEDLTRSDTLKAMLPYAEHIYVLADSEKFSKPGAVAFLDLKDVYEIITDDKITKKEMEHFTNAGITVTIAK